MDTGKESAGKGIKRYSIAEPEGRGGAPMLLLNF
jgi:hypothetical protein